MKFRILLLLLYILIPFGIFNLSYGKNQNFNYNANNISNYFSSLLSFNDIEYEKSQNFFKKINDTKKNTTNQSTKYLRSLINSEKYGEAIIYSRKLENINSQNFESNLILGLSEFKKGNYLKAKIHFNKINQQRDHFAVTNILKISLNAWSSIDEEGIDSIQNIPDRYENFRIIQETLAHCYFDSGKAEDAFKNILNDERENFSRYNFFYANYLLKKNKVLDAKRAINVSSNENPKNLLINQLNKSIVDKKRNKNEFNCSNKNHILAEIFYVVSNALSNQLNYELSNFYINLAKYLNPKFLSFESLLAENLFILKKYNKSVKSYNKLSKIGSVYSWYAEKQIAFIFYDQDKKNYAIESLKRAYQKINPDIYQIYDFANFLRNNEKYEEAITLYSSILSKINKSNDLYPKILDKRGTSYERINKLDLSEKDLLESLKFIPDQPYVINYLAYSWIEQGKNLDKSLKMLRKANELKKNDGYITDSLGWALFKLNKYQEAKEILKQAIVLMPTDPIINDHFADCLWKNNNKIQARYYWNYVLKLDSTDEKLRKTIKNKLIFGLENI